MPSHLMIFINWIQDIYYFFLFVASVRRSPLGRQCTQHRLAKTAGKWLTGSRDRSDPQLADAGVDVDN